MGLSSSPKGSSDPKMVSKVTKYMFASFWHRWHFRFLGCPLWDMYVPLVRGWSEGRTRSRVGRFGSGTLVQPVALRHFQVSEEDNSPRTPPMHSLPTRQVLPSHTSLTLFLLHFNWHLNETINMFKSNAILDSTSSSILYPLTPSCDHQGLQSPSPFLSHYNLANILPHLQLLDKSPHWHLNSQVSSYVTSLLTLMTP